MEKLAYILDRLETILKEDPPMGDWFRIGKLAIRWSAVVLIVIVICIFRSCNQ